MFDAAQQEKQQFRHKGSSGSAWRSAGTKDADWDLVLGFVREGHQPEKG